MTPNHSPSGAWKRYGNHFIVEDAPDTALPPTTYDRKDAL